MFSVSTDKQAKLIRFTREWADALAQASYTERLSETEIVRQAVAIRLRALAPENVAKVLERVGYQEESHSGRPPRAAAEANGSAPAQPGAEEPAGDWDLDARVP